MARGFESVRGASADIQARKEAGGEGGKLFFKLPNDGDTAVVRFLEQGDEVKWAWVHELPAREGKSFGQKVPCRDQNEEGQRTGDRCPGCDVEPQLKRTFQGVINLVWRDAPVFSRDDQNRVVRDNDGKFHVEGKEDQVAVWVAGITVFEELDGKDVTYKGLTSRDFRVTRRGTKLNTKYVIDPADPDGGPQEMVKADKELAKEKYDLATFTAPPDLDEWGKQKSGGASKPDEAPADTSPFARNRR